MLSLSSITKAPLGTWALIALMLATRAHSDHFGSPINLPDASLAVFFMAGLWFSSWRFFTVLLVEAALIDYVAITHMGVSDYCISPAYVFLIPTYGALFFTGRIAAGYQKLQTQDVLLQLGLLIGATSLAFLLSNGSFYVLSGRFGDLHWLQYVERVTTYYPAYISSTLVYCIVITGLVKLLTSIGILHRHSDKAI